MNQKNIEIRELIDSIEENVWKNWWKIECIQHYTRNYVGWLLTKVENSEIHKLLGTKFNFTEEDHFDADIKIEVLESINSILYEVPESINSIRKNYLELKVIHPKIAFIDFLKSYWHILKNQKYDLIEELKKDR